MYLPKSKDITKIVQVSHSFTDLEMFYTVLHYHYSMHPLSDHDALNKKEEEGSEG